MFSAYKRLSTRTRLGIGLGFVAWSLAGLYLSDRAEEKFGFTPSEEDKEELRRMTPKLLLVDRPDTK